MGCRTEVAMCDVNNDVICDAYCKREMISCPSLDDVFAIGLELSSSNNYIGMSTAVKHAFKSTTHFKCGRIEPTLAHSS